MGTFEIIKSFYISGAALWYGKNIQKHPKKSPLVPLQWQENNIWHSQVYFFSFLPTYKFSRNATRKKTQKFTTHEEILKALYIDRSFSFMWNSRLCHFPSLKGLQKSTVLKEPKDAFMTKFAISLPICQNPSSSRLVKNELRVFSESLGPPPSSTQTLVAIAGL